MDKSPGSRASSAASTTVPLSSVSSPNSPHLVLLDSFVALLRPDTRAERATAMAGVLGCHHLMILVQDPALGILLPAIGFPQTLRPASRWRAFLQHCVGTSCYSEVLPDPFDGTNRTALAVPADDGTVLVCFDPLLPLQGLQEIVHVLPLLGRVCREELQQRAEAGQHEVMKGAAADASRLAASLETARRDLELALRRAEELRQQVLAVVRYAPDPMFMVSPEGVLLQVNEAAQQLLGLQAQRPLEDCLGHRLEPEELRRVQAALAEAARVGQIRNVRFVNRLASGGSIPTSLNAAAWYGADRTVIGIIGTLRDMTSDEEVLAALKDSRSELQEKIEDLERFHDVVVGRELRMLELKQQIEQLRGELASYQRPSPPLQRP